MSMLNYSRGLYMAGIVFLVLLFLPQVWFPLALGKVVAAALCLLAAALLWAALVLRRGEPVPAAAWLIALLPLVYALSWALSADKAVGLLGSGLEADTVLFAALGFIAALLGAALFRTGRGGWLVLRALFISSLLAMLFQCVALFVGLPGPFADHSVNLVGKWNDFGILVSLFSLLLLVELEFGGLSTLWRALGWLAGVVALFLLSIVNFSLAWGLVLALALLVGAGAWLSGRRPWASGVAALVALAFLFFGAALAPYVSTVVPVSSLEVRPSAQSTFDVISAAHGSSVKMGALGTGPGTFGLMWLAHKPAGVSQSSFWNLDFNVGYSTLATAFGTAGLLGALAWLLPALLILAGLWRSRREAAERAVAWTLSGAALMLWVATVLYVPSPNLILLAFMLSGASLGLLWRGSISRRSLALAGTCVVVLLALCAGVLGVRRFASVSVANAASVALGAGDVDGAQALAAKAQAVEPTPEDLRLGIDTGNAKLQQIAAGAATADSQARFTSVLTDTIKVAQAALALDPQNYRSYVSLAQVYAFLAANKVPGAYENAKAGFALAESLSPGDPSIPLMEARLEAAAGTSTQALQDALRRSLSLKPDYTDAILFVVQLDIAQNDIPSAIRDAQAAVKSAPGVASLWFELGLLYYASGDTASALVPLQNAIQLEPDYANAQYFLGLAYAAQGRSTDAVSLFQALTKTNPDNTEVQAIVANLQGGKPALFGLATSTPPDERPTAPVR